MMTAPTKKMKKAVRSQLTVSQKTQYIPLSEPLITGERQMIDPEQHPLNYSFYEEEHTTPTYTLEQVQKLLEAQHKRIVDSFNV